MMAPTCSHTMDHKLGYWVSQCVPVTGMSYVCVGVCASWLLNDTLTYTYSLTPLKSSLFSPPRVSGCSCFRPFCWRALITDQISYFRHLAEDLIPESYNERIRRLHFNSRIIQHFKKRTSHSGLTQSVDLFKVMDALSALLTHDYAPLSAAIIL